MLRAGKDLKRLFSYFTNWTPTDERLRDLLLLFNGQKSPMDYSYN